jgi:hypothetical protein
MNKLQAKRLKKNENEGKPSRFKFSPCKMQRPKNLQDLINENNRKTGSKFLSMNNDSDEDYGFDEINPNKKSKTSFQFKSKITKTKKNKGKRGRGVSCKTVEEYLGGAESSDERDFVNSKTTIESNIWIKQRNTSYKFKGGKRQGK